MRTEEEQAAFKRLYIEKRGYWAEFNEGLLALSPEWLAAYLDYSSLPARAGPLSARMRELIYVAVDASTTHLFQSGLEIHVRIALEVGCTPGELIEVLQLATMQGIDSVSLGMAVLTEELADLGRLPPDRPEAAAALAHFTAQQTGRPPWLETMARLSPEWVEVLADLLATADRTARLTGIERGLIRLALAASPTHLYVDGIRTEVRGALEAGASAEEIAQVFQLVAHLGLHACAESVPTVMRAAGLS